MEIPKAARAIIIGGGVVGCSVAYHLSLKGWKDIVLLERKALTSGTTWHAAGLIGQLRASANMTKLSKYSQELYGKLEAETEVATGFRRTGSITLALTDERREEILRQASMARAFGVKVEELGLDEVEAMYPYVKIDDVRGAVFLRDDGQGDASNIALALAKGARQRGCKIIERTAVTGLCLDGRRVTGVDWVHGAETGTISCDVVVNCAGMWARDVGKMAGVNVPLHACEHFYIVTEAISGLGKLPVLRVPDECTYYKEDAGKLMIGAFEPKAKPWGMEGIPSDFEFDQLPDDFDQFAPILEMAIKRMPMLEATGITTFFNGPESFTPDNAYHIGLAPERDNVWVAAGFNSIGIQSAGGAGMALAEWMDAGEKPFDLGDVDIARMQPFQNNRSFLVERVSEALGLLYGDHFPYRQKVTGRGIRRSPLHEYLRNNGAVFGELAGWERANWYADQGQEPAYRYTWKRPNWFENTAREHAAVRENVGIYDMSSFGKLRVEGRDACAFLNHLCGANMSVPVGRIVYTQFLNSRGGIEADVTVTRLTEFSYLVVTPAATRLADETWLKRNIGDRSVTVTDVTGNEAVVAVMGPSSRELLRKVSSADFDNTNNPFGTAQDIEIGMGLARAHRVSYVGELGWELYIPTEMAAHVFEGLWDAGRATGARLCGMHMMDSCRIEKAFRHFGHDITCEDHVLEAGLGFAVKVDKPDFIGRDAVLRKRDQGLSRRLVQFRLQDPDIFLYHHEPILRDGVVSGFLTSGNYGHTLGAAIGMGYVPCHGESAAELLNSSFEIEVAGNRVAADASLRPMYDPTSVRVRA